MGRQRQGDSGISSDEKLYCSFCKKSQEQIRKLIAGPNVFICDECVDVCVDIVSDPSASAPRSAQGLNEASVGTSPLLTARCSLCRTLAVVEELVALVGRGAICKACVWAVRHATDPEEDADPSSE
jgi:hypothetical protein